MITNPKKFYKGVWLMLGFLIVLVAIFLPIYNQQNALNYLDSLYNSISKGSAYYIPELQAAALDQVGKEFEATLEMADTAQAAGVATLFSLNGAQVSQSGSTLQVTGDLGRTLGGCLEDADAMFGNEGTHVATRYGYPEKEALYNWWLALKELNTDLKRQREFDEAALVMTIGKKAVECAYNYYGIEPWQITEKVGIIVFSLVFYVIYTIWYGFAIILLFEGWGLKLSH